MEVRILPYDHLKNNLRSLLAGGFLNRSWNDMDEVWPGIFLGGVDAAKNIEKLRRVGITHIINSSFTPKPIFSALGVGTNEDFYKKQGFNCQFLGIQALDVSGFKLNKYFDTATDFIQSALDSKGKVLVHCFMGVSRSATLVIAYLMIKQGMKVDQAIKHVRGKRCIHPNDGFLDQLCHLHKQLFEDPMDGILVSSKESDKKKEGEPSGDKVANKASL